jgi:2-octaprenyl-6-methoxyphenol hydroxylase
MKNMNHSPRQSGVVRRLSIFRGYTMSNAARTFEAIVVGGGPAGLCAAILLARQGFETALVRKGVNGPDNRTTALMNSSILCLEEIGAWAAIEPKSAPLRKMRLIDDTGRLFRAPTAVFACNEIGLDAFGYNIPNMVLNAALEAVADAQPHLAIIEDSCVASSEEDGHVRLTLKSGMELTAPVIGAADGRESMLRNDAGIECWRWSYPQTAVTLNLEHSAPHNDTCTEFHTTAGPFTLVPLPQPKSSSLVAVVTPEDAAQLMAMDDDELAQEITRRSQAALGQVKVSGARAAWPLAGLAPKCFARRRIALIGEAAHFFPPIGAQGLNMGLRDAAMLAEVAADARRVGQDIGGREAMNAYDTGRKKDVWMRTFGIDTLNRTLLSPLVPAHMLRGFGLALANSFGPLRRFMMREGLRPSIGRPAMMG